MGSQRWYEYKTGFVWKAPAEKKGGGGGRKGMVGGREREVGWKRERRGGGMRGYACL